MRKKVAVVKFFVLSKAKKTFQSNRSDCEITIRAGEKTKNICETTQKCLLIKQRDNKKVILSFFHAPHAIR